MGRPSACLRIIACVRNSRDGNSNERDLRVSEVKSSKDKLAWSFRKKSARHRVLSNSVITERATYGNKENPDESTIFGSQFTGGCNDSGTCLTQCSNEKIQLVVSAKSLACGHAYNAGNGEEFVAKSDENAQESAVVSIQAAIRGLLARKKLLKLKDVVKPQPEVQGILVQETVTSLQNNDPLYSKIDPQEIEKREILENPPGFSLSFAPEDTESKLENETLVPSESEENLITYEGEKINFHPYRITNSIADGDAEPAKSDVHSLSINPKTNHFDEQWKVSEQLTNDRSKFTSEPDSRNASDTTLNSGGSKFEELAPIVNPMPSALVGSTYNSSGDSKTDVVSSKVYSAKEEKILTYAGSECGTELSISSTLDSPDRSEAGVILDGQGKGVQVKGTESYGDAKAEEISIDLSTGLTEKHLENLDDTNEVSDGSVVSLDVSQIEQKLKMNTPDPEKDLRFQEKLPSEEASFRSQELLQKPSSPVSTKSTRDKPDKRSPKRSPKNRKSRSSEKKSPSNPNHEQPRKDPTSGKKRDSFGSDQERRTSTSSNLLPHFMQATESARAKLQANNDSPKSSPDIQERDIYVNKRHSMPGTNVKQVSPRIQLSRKERKWQR